MAGCESCEYFEQLREDCRRGWCEMKEEVVPVWGSCPDWHPSGRKGNDDGRID